MTNIEIKYLEKCKSLIEKKLDWPPNSEWKHRDYETLSELIFEKTNTMISVSTLKRIWKKSGENTPHPGTLNSFALFLGYKHWHDFKSSNKESGNSDIQSAEGSDTYSDPVSENFISKSVLRLALILVPVLVITVLLIFQGISDETDSINFDYVTFSSKKVVTSGVPNSVIFDYDISSIKNQDISIQQTWDTRHRVDITPEKKNHTSVYYYPGFHTARLLSGDKIIKQQSLHITTSGWMPLARYTLNDLIPVYLPDAKIINNGRMYVSPKQLSTNNSDTRGIPNYVSYYNVRDFGNIDGDNFKLETSLKNDLKEGGTTGQYAQIIIMGENNRDLVPLSIPGVVSNLSLRFSENGISGKDNDLSVFGCDMSVWNDVSIDVNNKKVTIMFNGENIYNLEYENPIGRIIGLHFLFTGCGAVDFVKLLDQENNLIYSDEFDR